MLISNETVYNTDDVERLFDYAVINSTVDPAYADLGPVQFFEITYATRGTVNSYCTRDGRLSVALPRRSSPVMQQSPLTALAGSTEDSPLPPKVGDEDYCFVAPSRVKWDLIREILRATHRRFRGAGFTASGIPLRYCSRLKRGQKQAQGLGMLHYRIEKNARTMERIKKANIEIGQEIDKARGWFKKHGRDSSSYEY